MILSVVPLSPGFPILQNSTDAKGTPAQTAALVGQRMNGKFPDYPS
jgi:hypothetical protein